MPCVRGRTRDRGVLLRYLERSAAWLRAASGVLVVYASKQAHPGCEAWLEDAEDVLARLERLRASVEQSQGWQDEVRGRTPR